MTPRQETSLERAFGRMEGQIEAIAETLSEMKQSLEEGREVRQDMLARLERVERQNKNLSEVASSFNDLQQSIRDGKMQVRGIVMGVGLAAGTAGATLPTIVQKIWTLLAGA